MNVVAFPQRRCPECGDHRFADRCLSCGFEPSPNDIEPGIYAARYANRGCVRNFGSWRLWIDFYLPTAAATLRRWYGIVDFQNGRILAGQRSDLIRELSDVLNLRIGPHIPQDVLDSLRGKSLHVRVGKVVKDAAGNPLSAINQYLKVETMLPPRIC